MTKSLPREELQRKIESLGPWFHNMDVGGIRPASDHFLVDDPRSAGSDLPGQREAEVFRCRRTKAAADGAVYPRTAAR